MIERHDEWILIDNLVIKPLARNDYARYDLILSVLVAKEGTKKNEK